MLADAQAIGARTGNHYCAASPLHQCITPTTAYAGRWAQGTRKRSLSVWREGEGSKKKKIQVNKTKEEMLS